MENYIANYTDISEWDINRYVGTGGTRSKIIAIHPETEKQYFFKASKIDKFNNIKYPTEIWSEIVSSKIGQALGFNMLDYNIAYCESHRQKVGCISESMVEFDENKLTEGVTFLTGFDPLYRPSEREDQLKYTFQFICDTLKYFNHQNYIVSIIEIIIFDSIIGNSDRHQENWGTISYFKQAIDEIEVDLKEGGNSFFESLIKKLVKLSYRGFIRMHEMKNIKPNALKIQKEIAPNNFAPIYDSGCCLGREREDNKVAEMLKNKQMLEAYVRKGVSEIRWKGDPKKKNHFDLVKLVKQDYPQDVRKIISQVQKKYSPELLKGIIFNIDNELPDSLSVFKLSPQRKELMFKIITLRLEKLFELL